MKYLLLSICLISSSLFAQELNFNSYIKERWSLSKTQKKYLFEHKILADATVESDKKIQTFDLQAMALHKKSCKKALRKLSQLENYHKWISFIKESTYLEATHLYSLLADHPLLPYPMRIHIIVERPTKEGRYNFTFPTGMFTGLQGYFDIKEIDKKCLFYAESHWKGPETKIPSLIIEIFSETLSKIGGDILMRKSR